MTAPALVGRPPAADPVDLLGVEGLLSDDERTTRDVVRRFLADRVRPHVAQWYEQGVFPREIIPELGRLGLLGMHLDGYGCAEMSAVAYGLACMELEAADSGMRSFVSGQGSLAMTAIHKYRSEEQKRHWLARMATGAVVGCFGLTEPDFASNPAGMRTRAVRDGSDWVLTGTKMWIINGAIADVAVVWARSEDGIRGFLVPAGTPGFSRPETTGKLSLRASVTAELVLDGCRLPADAVLPGVVGLRGPLGCLNEARYGIVWGAMGAARDCYETALNYAKTRLQFDRPIAAYQLTQQKLVDMLVELDKGMLLALHLGRLKDAEALTPQQISLGKLNNVREALTIARTARTILGANGISGDYGVLRHANNLESVLSPTKAPARSTPWRSARPSPASRPSANSPAQARKEEVTHALTPDQRP